MVVVGPLPLESTRSTATHSKRHRYKQTQPGKTSHTQGRRNREEQHTWTQIAMYESSYVSHSRDGGCMEGGLNSHDTTSSHRHTHVLMSHPTLTFSLRVALLPCMPFYGCWCCCCWIVFLPSCRIAFFEFSRLARNQRRQLAELARSRVNHTVNYRPKEIDQTRTITTHKQKRKKARWEGMGTATRWWGGKRANVIGSY